MSGHPKFRPVAVIASLLFAFTFVAAQPQPHAKRQAKPSRQTPDEQPRKTKAEPNNAYTRWIKEDVALIITDPERKAFDKLRTNEEREQFIATFWRERDPDPDT